MKQLALLLVLLMGCLGIYSQIAIAETSTKHTVEMREYTTYYGSYADMTLNKQIPLYFIDGVNDLPYVEIKDIVDLVCFVHTEIQEDLGFDLGFKANGDIVTFIRENGYTLDMDFKNDKLIYEDYNAFNHHSMNSALLDLIGDYGVNENGDPYLITRDVQSSFDRYGDILTIDLAAYKIHLIRQGDKYYVPMQTVNDFLLLSTRLALIFNGQNLFLTCDERLYDYTEGEYTEVANIYYDAPVGERSDALAEYSYQELCLVLDTFYGLKESHDIAKFHDVFYEIAYDEPLSGNSAKDADTALKSFIEHYLDDLHSSFSEYSYLTGLGPISVSTGIADLKLSEHSKIYSDTRDALYPDGYPHYEEVGNTAYITFDSFTSNRYGYEYYDGDELAESNWDTIDLILYAHRQITRRNSPIENVVLDLSNNTGGSVDAAVVVLGWFLGDAPFSVKDTATGAMSTSVYRIDTNLDHVFDERDSVANKKLYCLISPVSFSCGNLVPSAFKSSQKVTLLGRTTAGGSCIVQPLTTAYGTVFQISSSERMSFLKNGSFYDIDRGVEPDYYIDNIENFYDRDKLTRYINSLF